MLVSVVIPTHNRIKLLKNALNSVLSQTYNNIEVIVVDDASDCNNEALISELNDDRIKFFRFSESKGGNACRNKGVQLSKSKYVAFLDDDDTWDNSKLKKQIEIIKNDIDLVYSAKNIITLDSDYVELSSRYSFKKVPQNIIAGIMKQNFIGTTSSILVKKDSFLKVGGFNEELPALQDYDLYIRLILNNNKIAAMKEPLVNYYIYTKNFAISKSCKNNLIATKIILRNNIKNSYILKLINNLVLYNIKILLKKLGKFNG